MPFHKYCSVSNKNKLVILHGSGWCSVNNINNNNNNNMRLVAGYITLIILVVPCAMVQGSFLRPLLLHKALSHPRLKLSQEVFANTEVCEKSIFNRRFFCEQLQFNRHFDIHSEESHSLSATIAFHFVPLITWMWVAGCGRVRSASATHPIDLLTSV
jgi:hypothetical protein